MTARMKLHEAFIFATKAHEGQKRKSTDIDYICHPMEVGQILTEIVGIGGEPNDDLIIAGILHDVLEECPDITINDIEEKFGEEVARLVAAHTHTKEGTWRERKEQALREFKEADRVVQIMITADKLSNLRSIYADYCEIGDEVWERFNAGKEDQCWYYNAFLDAIEEMQHYDNTRDAYWEATELFKDLFVSYYVDDETYTIWQKCLNEAPYACSADNPEWELTEEPIAPDAKPISRAKAEELEDQWRERRKKIARIKEHLAEVRMQVQVNSKRIREENEEFNYSKYLNMTDEEIEELLKFHGRKCCIFDEEEPMEPAEVILQKTEIVHRFGEALTYKDGTVINWFCNGSEGGRKLRICPDCGALFLEQFSEDCSWGYDDDIYTYSHDYYQVESFEHAVKLNLLLDTSLEAYLAPHISTYRVC